MAPNRRKSRRHSLPKGLPATVEFGYPEPGGHLCVMPLREISGSGLSFVLSHELPEIEVGMSLKKAVVRIGSLAIRGDLVIIRLSRDRAPGSVCGALFYPATDSDILKARNVIADLEAGRNIRARTA